MHEILRDLLEALERRDPVALVTIVEVQGASPAKVGFRGLVWADGRFQGNVGGGALEKHIREDAQQALREGKSRLVHYALRESGKDAVGMVCGGEATAFIEVFAPPARLLIIGGGHIGRPLAEMAAVVGYRVEVVDVHPERGTQAALEPESVDAHTYIVVATEDHRSDLEALRRVVRTPAAYVGMIGSHRKVHTVLNALRDEGVPDDLLARVRAPIGLDLGGGTPAEIALSILAEIQQVRHGATGQPLSALRRAPSGPDK